MRAQSSAARKSNVRAVLFEDLDEKLPTYGALCLGTMGFHIAGKRTADGRDWDWKTFGTGQGFFADLIVAGTMFAKPHPWWRTDVRKLCGRCRRI